MKIPSKQLLKTLYLYEKRSSPEIASILNCSQHKINYWLARYAIPKRSIAEAIYQKHNPNGDPFKFMPPKTLDEAWLEGLGLGLYWGEGNKKNKNSVRLGNTDPRIIKKFILFLIKNFCINTKKLRFGLQIFSDLNANYIVKFWLNELKEFGIVRGQFFKVTITPSRSIGTYRERSRWGVLTVHFANTKLKNLLDKMLPL